MPSKFDRHGAPSRTIMLDLSPRHLTAATIALLEGTPVDQWPVRGAKDMDGFFMYAHDENPDGAIPQDLWACCVFAHQHDCGWIRFDRDKEPYPELPIRSTDEELQPSPKLIEVRADWIKTLAEEKLGSEYDYDGPYVDMAEAFEGYVEEAREIVKAKGEQ